MATFSYEGNDKEILSTILPLHQTQALRVNFTQHNEHTVSSPAPSQSSEVCASVATRYGTNGPGTESRRGEAQEFSAPVQTGPGVQPASCTTGTGPFQGVKRPKRATPI